jgi:hypothetical protein
LAVLGLLLLCPAALETASQCGVNSTPCGPSANHHIHLGDMHAQPHECCDGLLCEDGVCQRPWGTPAPSAADLKALMDELVPEKEFTLESAKQQIDVWRGREERLFASIRRRYAKKKDEL